MRIIAGTHRGRRLAAPEGRTTRPMTDRVRENLFNLLGPGAADGDVVLDLFAGSGALGIEALSRGARWALFVETDGAALKALGTNLQTLRLSDRCRAARRDALRPGPWAAPDAGAAYSLVFADPPYRLMDAAAGRDRLAEAVADLAARGLVAPDAAAMVRTRAGVEVEPWPGFRRFDVRTYGTTTLHLMEREPEEGQAAP